MPRPLRSQTTPRPRARLAWALGAAITAVTTAQADCIDDAAARHQVNAPVLRAIGWQESRLQPATFARNANGSVDRGAFQINSVHLPELGRYGIDRGALADGCVSAEVAAWHYRRQVDLHGNSWQAVGAYHSQTPARAAWYANQIAAILMQWKVIAAGALPFPVDSTRGPARTPRPPRRAPQPSPPSPPASAAAGDGVDARAAFLELAYLPPAH